jgi:hypothetical protein
MLHGVIDCSEEIVASQTMAIMEIVSSSETSVNLSAQRTAPSGGQLGSTTHSLHPVTTGIPSDAPSFPLTCDASRDPCNLSSLAYSRLFCPHGLQNAHSDLSIPVRERRWRYTIFWPLIRALYCVIQN